MLRRRVLGLAVFGAIVVGASTSDAHFILKVPTNWVVQDTAGLPEKLGPCGNEYGDAAMPTGVVTAYQQGSTVTITIDEVVFHPGHYRIAIGDPDQDALPPEPAVDAGGGYPCGTAVIESPPVYPVIADNVFPHTTAFTTPQTTTIQLPANFTCDHCVLQVLEFMSDHGLNPQGGCFYHHCAYIAVGPDAGTTPGNDAGSSGDAGGPSPDAAVGAENETTQGGCGCSVPGGAATPLALGGLGLAAALGFLRRRKK